MQPFSHNIHIPAVALFWHSRSM